MKIALIAIGIVIIGALFIIQDFGSQTITDPVQSQPTSQPTQKAPEPEPTQPTKFRSTVILFPFFSIHSPPSSSL